MDAIAKHPLSNDGLCIGCGYPLRGLSESRCPECGRAFDPRDLRTMNVGRPMGPLARRLLVPVGSTTWWLHALGVAAFLWGWGWLPGALVVSGYAFLFIGALYVYRAVRLLGREVVLRRYRQCRASYPAYAGARYAPAVALLALGLAIAFNLPLRITLTVTSWVAGDDLWRMYAVDPMPRDVLGPRFIGPIYAESLHVSPGGVTIRVAGGGSLLYTGGDRPGLYVARSIGGIWYAFGVIQGGSPTAQVLAVVIVLLFFLVTWLGTVERAKRLEKSS